ncbi:MAG: hypothetical protein AB7T49_19985 [Oligoflexales bacterium]
MRHGIFLFDAISMPVAVTSLSFTVMKAAGCRSLIAFGCGFAPKAIAFSLTGGCAIALTAPASAANCERVSAMTAQY